MTAPIKVLVYDDETNSANDLQARLGAISGVQAVCIEDATTAVEGLEARRRDARAGLPVADATNVFDDADILVVDYDLTVEQNTNGPRVGAAETGERIAYLVRCYSRCRFIVALNQYATSPTFDLTMLGHPSSYADLNISGGEIDNPSLWGEAVEGYQPWWWPNLRQAPRTQLARAAEVATSFDVPVLTLLGLDDARVRNGLTRRQLGWLSSKANPHDVTVQQAMDNGRIGFKPRDVAWDEEGRAAVAAARIGKWLERLVLPGQDVVIDAPHLVSRYPSLLTDGPPTRTSLRGDAAPALIDGSTITDHATTKPAWFPRPTWLWPKMTDDDRIEEVANPFGNVDDIGSFCEDVSRFLPTDQARAYNAEFVPFNRRFVADPPPDDALRTGRWGIENVNYDPAIAFALA